MKRLAIFVAFALASCASHPDRPDVLTGVITDHTATPTSCIAPDLPGPPVYPDTPAALIAAPNGAAMKHLLERGWGDRNVRLALLESVVAICRAVPITK